MLNGKTAVTVDVDLSPEQIAELFWRLGDDGQADFFAHLDRIAGVRLCMQMAYLSDRLIERSHKGDWSGRHAYQAIAEHAQSLWRTSLDKACDDARRELEELTEALTC